MASQAETAALPERFSTGVAGLDTILGGGFFRGGIYVVSGRPGAGKTIFANQACFQHAARGERALYVTLLAENHARMLTQMRSLSFFRQESVGTSIHFISAFDALAKEGLDGLLRVVQKTARDLGATLLVLDGMVTAENLARNNVDYKRFIHELQTWCGLMECSVILLTSTPSDPAIQPEHSMVEGIIELCRQGHRMRSVRLLSVTKFRGGPVLEGEHSYVIDQNGLDVFPRLESLAMHPPVARDHGARAGTGVAALDRVLGGGFPVGSASLVLGPTGCGKTMLGMQFLEAGAAHGENGLLFTFFENAVDLVERQGSVWRRLRGHLQEGRIHVCWQPPTERILDAMGATLVDTVVRQRARRVFMDGLAGFREALPNPERLSAFFAALTQMLADQGVTTLVSEETRDLLPREAQIPTTGVSATFQNILFLRHVEDRGHLTRVVSVVKMRDSPHEHGTYRVTVGGDGLDLHGALPDPAPGGRAARTTRATPRRARVRAKARKR
ncbi:MAG: ATPase domain-containing protein [Myxococcota bacterium]